jgi:hypothetical protein
MLCRLPHFYSDVISYIKCCNIMMSLKCDPARKIMDDLGFPRTPDRLLKFCGTHVWLLEVFKTRTSTCGSYNLGGSAIASPSRHAWTSHALSIFSLPHLPAMADEAAPLIRLPRSPSAGSPRPWLCPLVALPTAPTSPRPLPHCTPILESSLCLSIKAELDRDPW